VVKMRFDPEILWRAAWLTLAAALGLAVLWFGALAWRFCLAFGLAIIRQAQGSWTSKSNSSPPSIL
jgi:hypothetical protein